MNVGILAELDLVLAAARLADDFMAGNRDVLPQPERSTQTHPPG